MGYYKQGGPTEKDDEYGNAANSMAHLHAMHRDGHVSDSSYRERCDAHDREVERNRKFDADPKNRSINAGR